MNTCETIERAAIFYNGVIYSVPRPGRHHTVIAMIAELCSATDDRVRSKNRDLP